MNLHKSFEQEKRAYVEQLAHIEQQKEVIQTKKQHWKDSLAKQADQESALALAFKQCISSCDQELLNLQVFRQGVVASQEVFNRALAGAPVQPPNEEENSE